jgi:integrase
MKLTPANVRTLSLPEGVQDRTFFDDDLPRFGIRMRAGGSSRWIVQYAVGRRERRVVLGPVSGLDAGKARSLAKDILARVRLGDDPLAEKHESAARASETLGSLLPRYLAHKRAALRPRSYVEVERHLLVHAKRLHSRPLAGLAEDRRLVALLLANIAETSGPTCANMVRSSLTAFFRWLMREGLLEANPAIATNRAAAAGARERVLSDAELKIIWNALDNNRYGAMVKLLALLGLRREEIGGLVWGEIHLDQGLIRLPAARCKNKRPHDVPLPRLAVAILEAQPRADGSNFVFGGSGQGGFGGWSSCKRALDAKLGDAVAPWTMHDLRRVISTAMHERLRIPPHIVEACLGHHSGHRHGVAGTYNRAEYADEKRIALDKWADLLDQIVIGKRPATVVRLPKRR